MMTGTCERCGATFIHDEKDTLRLCCGCEANLYGGREKHEKVRLFQPAPEPMKGQTTLSL